MLGAKLLPEREFNDLMEKKYNPPANVADLGEEWFAMQGKLISLLTELTPKDLEPGEAFVAAYDYGLSRHIEFEVCNKLSRPYA